MKKLLPCFAAFALLFAGLLQPSASLAQGTAFTYQGRLADAGNPANGQYDLTFTLWDDAVVGNRQSGTQTNSSVPVSNGLFTVTLDFGGGIFTGPARWLELGVRTNGGGAFTLLTPRQACTPAPYAIAAGNAATVSGNVAASQITGTLSAANLGAGLITAANLAANAAAANLNAAGQSGVASSGLILSTTDHNTNLANAGYVKIYGSFGTPDAWQPFTNAAITPAPSARKSHTAVWTGVEMIVWGGYGESYFNDGARYNPAVNGWTALPTVPGQTPAPRLNHTAVWTGSAMIVWGGVGGTNYFNDGGLYDPVLNGWTYLAGALANAPSARLSHTAVWTGSAMIVWGGLGGAGDVNDGGLYNPGLNQWTYLPNSLANSPGPRYAHTAVWTGSEMIIWGGYEGGSATLLGDGARYSPSANHWITVSSTNAPAAREAHTAVWTGTEMMVWGGFGNGGGLNDGGRYNPALNSWSSIANTLANTPVAREFHTAVWTGNEMIVWGGYNDGSASPLNDGGRYNPISNSWTYIVNSLPNTPAARSHGTAVWTGSEMIVWGGAGNPNVLNDGGRYNPASNAWIYLPNSLSSIPSHRSGHTALWTGAEMIVWGGADATSYLSDGGRFDPVLNHWNYIPNSLPNAPSARQDHTAIWTGGEMIIWGGVNNLGYLNDGGRYSPMLNSWTALPGTATNAPAARAEHTAVWTGGEMIVWGGVGNAGCFNDGSRFSPASNGWTYLAGTLANAPAARDQHAAVWTGQEMIVWGGASNATCYADGGRYNPSSNLWTSVPNTLANTPGARAGITAIWTGQEMIVWGGTGGGSLGALNDGGRYNPALNSWTALPNTLSGTPSARAGNTTLWTGTEMIAWGGANGATYYADGGRYNPAMNSWTSIPNTLANDPLARAGHTAVWTGGAMLVWGGAGAGFYNDTFGYSPGRVLYLYQRP